MREIKFRAWDKEKNQMVTAMWRMTIDLHGNIMWAIDHYDFNGRLLEREQTDGNDRFELMQYTGLKDKNGKEIYEGDILKVYDDFFRDGLDDEYGVVKFENGRFYIDTFKKYPNECFCHFEIIGNIHKNPELMEVENE